MPPLYTNFFDLLPVSTKQSSRIESIATWREHFFFGTDGRVHVYQILGYDTKKPESKPRAVIAVSPSSGGKSAPVRQIALLPEKGLMIVLCGDSLAAHALPPYEAICRDSVPSSLFEHSKDILRDPGDVGGFHLKRENGKYVLACYTTARRVLIYEYYDSGKAFKKTGEYPIPERPRAIMWAGARLLLAFKGSYTLLTPTPASATGGAPILPEMIMDTGRSGESCAVNLDPHPEYLIGIDTIGGRVPINGKAPSAGCKWQGVPQGIAYRDPYVLAVQSDALEVYYPWRQSHSQSLVHSLARKGINRLSQRSFVRVDDPPQPRESINDQRRDAIVAVDSGNSIYLLHMLSIDQQVGELVSQGEFEAALELCERCALEVSEKAVKTVHFRFAMARLFNSPDVDSLAERLKRALEHFNTCEADPLHVVSLFPNFLPRELSELARSHGPTSSGSGGPSSSSSAGSPSSGGGSGSSAVEKTLPLDRNPAVRDKCLELLMGYLESHRSRIMSNRAAAAAAASAAAMMGGGAAGGIAPMGNLAQTEARNEAEKRTLTAIDTALLKTYIYLRREDKLASTLLNVTGSSSSSASASSSSASASVPIPTASHFCAVDNCISFLLERGEWVALALFRRSKGLHDAALRDLRLLGTRGSLPDGLSGGGSSSGGGSASVGGVTPAPPNLPKLPADLIEMLTTRFTHAEIANTRRFLSKATIEHKLAEELGEMSGRARTVYLNQAIGVLTSITYLRTSLDVSAAPLLSELHTEYSRWLLCDLPPVIGVLLFTGLDVPGVSPQRAANLFDPSIVVSKNLAAVEGAGGLTSRPALVSAYLGTVLGDDGEGSVREALHDMHCKVLIGLIADRRAAAEAAGTPITDDGLGGIGATFSSNSGGGASPADVTAAAATAAAAAAAANANNSETRTRRGAHINAASDATSTALASTLLTPEQRLFLFLQRSRHYGSKQVAQWLEASPLASTVLTRQRAVVYSRQGEHQKAITMLLEEGRDMAAAKAYATNAAREGSGGAFRLLLEELTRPREADTPEIRKSKTEQALQVINTCVGVDAATAVPMLPDDTPLSQLSNFLVASLRASHTARRNLEVSAAVSTTQLRQAELAVLQQKRRFVELSDSTECCRCGFKIRKDQMFAVFPSGTVAHQLCYEHASIDPATRQDYRQGIHTIYL